MWATALATLVIAVVAGAAHTNTSAPSPELWRLINLWDPALVLPWSTLGVSSACATGMQYFSTSLRERQPWASKMLDATGRSSSKFLFGNDYWLGSRVECEEVDRLATLATNFTLQRTTFRVVTLGVNFSHPLSNPKPRRLSMGLCLPVECGSAADVGRLLEVMLQATEPTIEDIDPTDGGVSNLRQFQVLRVKLLPGNYTYWTDPAFLIMLVTCSLIFVLTVVGTSLDLFSSHEVELVAPNTKEKIECNGNHLSYTAEGPEENDHMKINPLALQEDTNTRPMWRWKDALKAFSMRQNARRFFSTRGLRSQDGSLTSVHGLRVFSLTWVITCHTCLFAFNFSDNKLFRSTVEREFLYQSISNGNFSVDTFFFISGLLITYVFLKAEARRPTEANPESWSTSGYKFAGIFSYRIIRLTPPYLFVLGLVLVSMRLSVSNSVFDPPTLDHVNCANYWWRNALYINTLFPVNDMCMIWSWYLAADTQFYIVGTALLLIFVRRPRVALGCGLALLLSSWLTTGAISLSQDHLPSIEEPFALFDDLYDKPWTRFGPYLVGMAGGWLLQRTDCNIKMTKMVVTVGWMLCLTGSFALVHALYGQTLGALASAAYVALSHTLWAATIAWVLIACTTGHGGWITRILSSRLLVPFSRATYCAYLVHPAIMQWVLLNMDGPITMSRGIVIMLMLGFLVASYMMGILISLFFEAPVIRLLDLVHPIKCRKALPTASRER